jgi:hypothetical protein
MLATDLVVPYIAILNQLLLFARCKLSLVDDFPLRRRGKSSRIAIEVVDYLKYYLKYYG